MHILAFNMSVGAWLQYAICSIASHLVTALPILLGTFLLTYVILGLLWSKCWNKDWKLSKTPARWFCVGLASLVVAGSLTCADSLYGSNFFNTQIAAQVKDMPNDDETDKTVGQLTDEDGPAAVAMVQDVAKFHHRTADSEEPLAVNRVFADAYASALTFLWGMFITALLLLVVCVPLAAYNDIARVKPL